MSLACRTEIDLDACDYDWTYYGPLDHRELEAKRSRRCKSCSELIKPGEQCVPFARSRMPRSDIEENIYVDEVPLATWYYCDRCGHQAHALSSLGFTWSLGADSTQDLVTEYKVQYQGSDDPCNERGTA